MTITIPKESSQVVKETLQREIDRLKEKIDSHVKQLQKYEEQHQFSSEIFLKKYNSGDQEMIRFFSNGTQIFKPSIRPKPV